MPRKPLQTVLKSNSKHLVQLLFQLKNIYPDDIAIIIAKYIRHIPRHQISNMNTVGSFSIKPYSIVPAHTVMLIDWTRNKFVNGYQTLQVGWKASDPHINIFSNSFLPLYLQKSNKVKLVLPTVFFFDTLIDWLLDNDNFTDKGYGRCTSETYRSMLFLFLIRCSNCIASSLGYPIPIYEELFDVFISKLMQNKKNTLSNTRLSKIDCKWIVFLHHPSLYHIPTDEFALKNTNRYNKPVYQGTYVASSTLETIKCDVSVDYSIFRNNNKKNAISSLEKEEGYYQWNCTSTSSKGLIIRSHEWVHRNKFTDLLFKEWTRADTCLVDYQYETFTDTIFRAILHTVIRELWD